MAIIAKPQKNSSKKINICQKFVKSKKRQKRLAKIRAMRYSLV